MMASADGMGGSEPRSCDLDEAAPRVELAPPGACRDDREDFHGNAHSDPPPVVPGRPAQPRKEPARHRPGPEADAHEPCQGNWLGPRVTA